MVNYNTIKYKRVYIINNSKTIDGYKYILFVYDTFENIKNSKTDIAAGIVNISVFLTTFIFF